MDRRGGSWKVGRWCDWEFGRIQDEERRTARLQRGGLSFGGIAMPWRIIMMLLYV